MKIKFPGLKFQKEFFPFLLPFFFITHYYTLNYPYFPPRLAINLFVKYLLAIFFLNFLSLPFLKSWRKSSFFTFFLLCIQFFYIFLYEFLSARLAKTIFSKDFFILGVLVLVLIWLFLRLKQFTGSLSKLVNFFNFLLISWIFIELFKFIGLKNYLSTELKKTIEIKEFSNGKKPDIYLLLLDEYAGQKELIDKFQFDNSEFLSYLSNKSFHIVRYSKSNYNLTSFSMASMLSLDTLKISNYRKPKTKDYTLTGLKINQSPVGHYFQQNGYEIYNLSIFNFLNLQSHFTHSYMRNFDKEFSLLTLTGLIQKNYPDVFFPKSKKNDGENSLYQDLNYNIAIKNFFLNQLPFKSNKPKFVYAHFLMPHFPHFLNEKGQLNDPEIQNSERTYLGYLKYCNLQLISIIDKILSSSAAPPIILLMSDHGFRGFSKSVDSKYYFMNLNAVFLPNGNYSGFYDGMSNVNEFRVILNSQFGQKLPLLNDSTFLLKEY